MTTVSPKAFLKRLNSFNRTKPNTKSFLRMLSLIADNKYITSGYSDFMDIVENNSAWQQWFVENSCFLVFNNAFRAACDLRKKRSWMVNLSSMICSEDAIKRTLKKILRSAKGQIGDPTDYLQFDDPMLNVFHKLRIAHRYVGDFSTAAISEKVLNEIDLLGGEKLIKYWYECLSDAGIINNSYKILNDL